MAELRTDPSLQDLSRGLLIGAAAMLAGAGVAGLVGLGMISAALWRQRKPGIAAWTCLPSRSRTSSGTRRRPRWEPKAGQAAVSSAGMPVTHLALIDAAITLDEELDRIAGLATGKR
jgi:hypothetical protein